MKFTHSNNSPFYLGLRSVVDAHFKQRTTSRFADWNITIKAFVLIGTYFTALALIMFYCESFAAFALWYAVMGVSAVMIVFNLVHDASHNALSKRSWVNSLGRYIGDFVGINTYIWDIRHNIQHHTFTNVLGGDLIIENIPLIRLSQHQPHHKMHRYQLFYAPLLYLFYSFYWIMVIDFKLFFKKEICNFKNIKHPTREWVKLFVFKGIYLTHTLILPWLLTPLSFGQTLLLFMIGHWAAGGLLSMVAVLGHFVEGPSFPEPQNGKLHTSWAEHELAATIDFAPNSKVANWITGGLNTHVVHHLFPKMCHTHYYEVTKLIESYCKDNGYPYRKESFVNALRSHFRYLKRLGENG